MKTFFRLLSVLAAAALVFLRIADYHPPPVGHEAHLHTFAAGSSSTNPTSGCFIDPNFEPVYHRAQAEVKAIFSPLALAVGNDPDTYSIELMQDRRGHRAINAMTCASSRLIWVSVAAWEELNDHEPALALILAHELAHADHRHPAKLHHDNMTATERDLLSKITPRQKIEIAADQRAADLMAQAGYTPSQIYHAAHYILARDDNGMLSKATLTHPSGRDRINLLAFYIGRTMLPSFAR